MAKNNIIQTLGDKEMDRKEFLKYSGLALLGLFGLKGVVTLLSSFDERSINTNRPQIKPSRGFGSGKYGA